jgi:hypothetical protein
MPEARTFTDQVRGEIIFLDLSSVNLFGFESMVFGDKARIVVDRIERGEDIEPVPVVREGDDYFLTTLYARAGFKEGGHTRAYVH